jgi:hypothetical protein
MSVTSVLSALLVLAGAAWLFGWFDLFHAAVGLPVAALVAFLGRIVVKRRASALRDDPDALLDDERAGAWVSVLAGLASGAAIALVLSVVFRLAAATPLYPALVDARGRVLLSQAEMLEGLGQWEAVTQLLETLPQETSPAARARLAQKKVEALIRRGDDTRDVADACALFRLAARVASEEALDARLARSKLEWCAARTAARPLPEGTRARIVSVERLAPQSLKVGVQVTDQGGRALAGLVAADFTVAAGGQPVRVSTLATEFPRLREGRRLTIVLDTAGPDARLAVATAAYLVTGLSPGDSMEVVVCGPAARVAVSRTDDPFVVLRSLQSLPAGQGCALAEAVDLALDRLTGGSRRTLVVIAQTIDGSPERVMEVEGRLRAGGPPVLVAPLGQSAGALGRMAEASGGAVYDPARREHRESLRAHLRGAEGTRPLTYALIMTDVPAASGRLDITVGAGHAVAAAVPF